MSEQECWVVWNCEIRGEGVIFDNRSDAYMTSTGDFQQLSPAIGETFFEFYEDGAPLFVEKVRLLEGDQKELEFKTLSFDDLRAANRNRQSEWPGSEKADVAFRTIEVAGEFGEVSEAIKKFLRGQKGMKGTEKALEEVADEMADAVVALDLLAEELGIDLGESVKRKFNATSDKYGLSTKFPE